MIISDKELQQDALRAAISSAYRQEETACIDNLLSRNKLSSEQVQRIQSHGRVLVEAIRSKRIDGGGIDAFLMQYDLSNMEGIALMCLAEALLRIPDSKTADDLISDKILSGNWYSHAGKSDSLFVNATTWGLMLTGKLYSWKQLSSQSLQGILKKVAAKSGGTVIRASANYAMKILGRQFVMGRTIEEALKRAKELEAKGYRYSYDMLGEAAMTASDAERYFQAYQKAITSCGKVVPAQAIEKNPSISVKLSAIYPRYEFGQKEKLFSILVPRLIQLAEQAKQNNVGLTIDAEEADRLELSLDIFEAVFTHEKLNNWSGFGFAVQAYQKRAPYVIAWLEDLAKRQKKCIPLRLIKGAYWDSEIKISQEQGFAGYPVFTRKSSTDVSFMACARQVIEAGSHFYPQFSTHNAYSVAAILEMVGERKDFEFQCLHGMGQPLYDEIVGPDKMNYPCRIYAPVGSHEDLLPYLVRRLLENGANTSFVNRIVDASAPIDELLADPIEKTERLEKKAHPRIPLPVNMFPDRKNSQGIDLTSIDELTQLNTGIKQALQQSWDATQLATQPEQKQKEVVNPSDTTNIIGFVVGATEQQVEQALATADEASFTWDRTAVDERAACLEKTADLIEAHRYQLIALLVREAGKTLDDAIAEYREAADFCRYYAMNARNMMGQPQTFIGPTGECNQMRLHGRGPIACISPWNFPLAIFVGQISAALVSGNPVLAKPADQTPLIANYVINLFHQAGIPPTVLHFLPGRGSVVGAKLTADLRVKGVMFTGSTETAQLINQTLVTRGGSIVPFIAETGGQNAMLVDSSALTEQVVDDVLHSAFYSAGQRCSALRILYVQDLVADKIIAMLKGAMDELQIGDPMLLATDIGPVIDAASAAILQQHVDAMQLHAKWMHQARLNDTCSKGTFFPPTLFEIEHISQLQQEVFGPILHIIRFKLQDLDQVIADVNATGYGLTMGIHSRIDERVHYIAERVRIGNLYVNRAMTGAVVGVQPFGGEGLSGTGPKAGGPHYLHRLCTERTISIDTTAAGGNASLMTLQEE